MSDTTTLTILKDPALLTLPPEAVEARALIERAITLASRARWRSSRAELVAEDIALFAGDALACLKEAVAQETAAARETV